MRRPDSGGGVLFVVGAVLGLALAALSAVAAVLAVVDEDWFAALYRVFFAVFFAGASVRFLRRAGTRPRSP